MKYNGIIIDAHTHIMNTDITTEKEHGLVTMERKFGYDNFNVLSLEAVYEGQNDACHKLSKQTGCYVFAGLNHRTWKSSGDFVRQAEEQLSLGALGYKMIEGKPGAYKDLGKPLNAPSMMEFYAFMEAQAAPILLHAADPPEFWSVETAPPFAVENGWTYEDGSFPSVEQIHSEVNDILYNFPKLKLVLAHFYFIAHDLDYAVNILQNHKYCSFDICPGIEMFPHFSKRPDDWRRFFIEYSDRIIFGTDNYDGEPEVKDIINNTIHNFLQTPDVFKMWDRDIIGIDLPCDVLEKIYYKNFERLIKR